MRKIISVALGALITLNMMVGCAISDDEWKKNTGEIKLDTMTVSGDGIAVEGNKISITKGGDFTVTGTLADGMIYINAEEKVKLRLSGTSITNSKGPAIFFDNTEEALITITKETENFLADGKESVEEEADAVIFSNDDLEIKGEGTLTVTGNYQHGIAGDDDILIENGNIIISSYEHGVKVNDTLHITGGDIDITTETGKGMKAELEVIIDNGNINIDSFDEGIESKGVMLINGGNINITSDEDGLNTGNASATDTTAEQTPDAENPRMRGERPEGEMPSQPPEGFDGQTPPQPPEGFDGQTPPQPPEGFDGQTPPQPPEGFDGQMPPQPPEGFSGQNPPERHGGSRGGMFDMVDEETASAHAITISGGNLYINAGGDGIDSNGNLTISGGRVVVDGPVMGGNGSLDSQGTMLISGGEVITTSTFGMIQLPRGEGNLNMARISLTEKQAGGTPVSISDAEGNELMKVTPVNEYQLVVFASEKLKADKEYVVYVNGVENQRFTQTAGTASAGQVGFGGRGFGGMQGGRGNRRRVTVRVKGQDVRFETNPVIKNDTTLVGYRAIMEALGADVEWNEEEQKVTAKKGDTVITLVIGSLEADVNGEKYNLLTAPEIIGNSTMVPVRFISEQIGMKVGWDEALQLVTVDEQ